MNERKHEAWGVSEAYEQYVGRWSREVARQFLAWLHLPDNMRWGDIGCGTGALTAQILASAQPGSVLSIDRAVGFLTGAKRNIPDRRAWFVASDASSLPWADASMDASVSGLVLNFVPDASRMVEEMARITRPMGRVAVYVWDYKRGMEMMRYFWDAAIAVDPQAAALDEGERFPICHPEPLTMVFQDAGLGAVETRAIDIPTTFRSFDDFWFPFLGGQGPAPTYLASLSSEARERIRGLLMERLTPEKDGSVHLTARAWAVRGTK